MIELNNFLAKYFPDISHQIINNIKSNTDLDTKYESDYYGGQSCSYSKAISIYKIAEILIDNIYEDEIDYIDFNQILVDISSDIVKLGEDGYEKLTLKNQLQDSLENSQSKIKKVKI